MSNLRCRDINNSLERLNSKIGAMLAAFQMRLESENLQKSGVEYL